MAIRSSAGTGVTISLIVFVLLTVLLLAGSIILWGRLDTAETTAAEADEKIAQFVSGKERNAPWFSQLESAGGRGSYLGKFNDRYEELRTMATGGSGDAFVDVEAARAAAGIEEGQSLAAALTDARRSVADLTATNDALKTRTAAAEQDRDRLQAMVDDAIKERDALVEAESRQLKQYEEADVRYASAIQKAVSDFDRIQTSSRNQSKTTIATQEDEIDRLTSDNRRLSARLRDLEIRLNRDRLRAANPAALVDGHILDVVGSGDMVYIDKGRNDQVVLGMTFEVYDSPEQIRADLSGDEARGKASIQVVKVGEASSTAKVTRSVKGHPILPNNVVANAIYDPEYNFKFLVHGKFDLNDDGKPSEDEAEYLRDRIRRWGGEVVMGDEIPGDLDFLVLGVEPRMPIEPQGVEIETSLLHEHQKAKAAVTEYKALLDQATQAGIPVLNQYRLDILTGRSDL